LVGADSGYAPDRKDLPGYAGGADLSTFTPRGRSPDGGNQMSGDPHDFPIPRFGAPPFLEDYERGNIRESLGRIEAKVDIAVTLLNYHGIRISAVEKRQWFTAGGISLAVALLVPKIKTLIGL
jgi:hypothetical protein